MGSELQEVSKPQESGSQLRALEPVRGVLPPSVGAMVLLLVLCAVPRVWMAWKIPAVGSDGALYVRIAQAVEQGDFSVALREFHLNIYPAILAALHGLGGLDWEMAAKVWGVAVSCLAVLPVFGLMRRIFDDRVAWVGGLLYAFHPQLIAWCPELLRDATFWFFFSVSLYLIWRAVTEVRTGWFALAGIAITCSIATRMEGFFLFVPLGIWAFCRFRSLAVGRGKLALGLVVCLAAAPLALLLVNLVVLRGQSTWEFSRGNSMVEAYQLVRNRVLGGAGATLETEHYVVPAEREPGYVLGWRFYKSAERGLSPVWEILAFAGFWICRRSVLRGEQFALLATSLLFVGAILVHLWIAQTSCDRYFLPIAIMSLGWGATGLLALAAWVEQKTAIPRMRWVGAMAALLAIGGSVAALAADFSRRVSEPQLGQWIAKRCGPSAVIVATEGPGAVIAHYAGARVKQVGIHPKTNEILAAVREMRPDAVVLVQTNWIRKNNPEYHAETIARLGELGFSKADLAQLPDDGGQFWNVLVRPDARGSASAVQAARK